MKETLTTSQAAHILLQDEFASWSYSGAHALIEYLEELEAECETEIEFDRVAIRCDFSEYGTLIDWALDYFGTEYLIEACESMGIEEDIAMQKGDNDSQDIEDAIREHIQDNGTLIEFDGGIIVSSF